MSSVNIFNYVRDSSMVEKIIHDDPESIDYVNERGLTPALFLILMILFGREDFDHNIQESLRILLLNSLTSDLYAKDSEFNCFATSEPMSPIETLCVFGRKDILKFLAAIQSRYDHQRKISDLEVQIDLRNAILMSKTSSSRTSEEDRVAMHKILDLKISLEI